MTARVMVKILRNSLKLYISATMFEAPLKEIRMSLCVCEECFPLKIITKVSRTREKKIKMKFSFFR